MPIMDGLEFVRRVREHEVHRSLINSENLDPNNDGHLEVGENYIKSVPQQIESHWTIVSGSHIETLQLLCQSNSINDVMTI